jgi:hypothetical protein
MMRIYVTHCSAAKDDSLKGKGKVPPIALYTSPRIRAFSDRCIARKVSWAIFSDEYGLWFPDEMHEWYEKGPYDVTEEEFQTLLSDFDERLDSFDEIVFYINPARQCLLSGAHSHRITGLQPNIHARCVPACGRRAGWPERSRTALPRLMRRPRVRRARKSVQVR